MKVLLKSGRERPRDIFKTEPAAQGLGKISPLGNFFDRAAREIYFVATCRNRDHSHCAAPPNLLKDKR
ncbi:MAG: hypothetical protein JNL35_08155 [Sphingopyxis sp.]|nr:hypothetical protein [Sphingopyxis sp.]